MLEGDACFLGSFLLVEYMHLEAYEDPNVY